MEHATTIKVENPENNAIGEYLKILENIKTEFLNTPENNLRDSVEDGSKSFKESDTLTSSYTENSKSGFECNPEEHSNSNNGTMTDSSSTICDSSDGNIKKISRGAIRVAKFIIKRHQDAIETEKVFTKDEIDKYKWALDILRRSDISTTGNDQNSAGHSTMYDQSEDIPDDDDESYDDDQLSCSEIPEGVESFNEDLTDGDIKKLQKLILDRSFEGLTYCQTIHKKKKAIKTVTKYEQFENITPGSALTLSKLKSFLADKRVIDFINSQKYYRKLLARKGLPFDGISKESSQKRKSTFNDPMEHVKNSEFVSSNNQHKENSKRDKAQESYFLKLDANTKLTESEKDQLNELIKERGPNGVPFGPLFSRRKKAIRNIDKISNLENPTEAEVARMESLKTKVLGNIELNSYLDRQLHYRNLLGHKPVTPEDFERKRRERESKKNQAKCPRSPRRESRYNDDYYSRRYDDYFRKYDDYVRKTEGSRYHEDLRRSKFDDYDDYYRSSSRLDEDYRRNRYGQDELRKGDTEVRRRKSRFDELPESQITDQFRKDLEKLYEKYNLPFNFDPRIPPPISKSITLENVQQSNPTEISENSSKTSSMEEVQQRLSLDESFKTNSEEIGDLRVCIIDQNSVNGNIAKEKWEQVLSALNRSILKRSIDHPDLPGPAFSYLGIHMSKHWYQCENEFSLSFLKETVACMGTLWPSAKIKVVDKRSLERTKAKVWITDPSLDLNHVNSILLCQNSMIAKSDLLVLGVDGNKSITGKCVILEMSKNAEDYIRGNGCMLNFGMDKIMVTFSNQKLYK